jgi:rsbT co-antagonist protein RsbR
MDPDSTIAQLAAVAAQQRATISELQTPVIQVWDRILALPIIGTLDTARTLEMTEALLAKIVDTAAEIVIVDLTAVPMIDSAVAKHLLETVAAARLVGAEAILVGMAPRIAMTLVHLGIDLSGILTKGTLAQGLEFALAHLDLEVLPIPTA